MDKLHGEGVQVSFLGGYLPGLSAELIQTYPLLAEIRRRALRSASLQTTGTDSAPDSTRL